WQRRFWEHTIRDEQDYAAHMDYVHINPMKHGLVACVRDWPYSSFHRYIARGVYAPDWAGQGVDDLPAGERGVRYTFGGRRDEAAFPPYAGCAIRE
ncbi:MAG: hypothetical protein Q8Q28_06680, partial [Pseudomonadota bacterium]|nr:hypothetical protein [Pseudomonadota bacterium]